MVNGLKFPIYQRISITENGDFGISLFCKENSGIDSDLAKHDFALAQFLSKSFCFCSWVNLAPGR
jgi:hypothetical protein